VKRVYIYIYIYIYDVVPWVAIIFDKKMFFMSFEVGDIVVLLVKGVGGRKVVFCGCCTSRGRSGAVVVNRKQRQWVHFLYHSPMILGLWVF